jgi:hypothetical protein
MKKVALTALCGIFVLALSANIGLGRAPYFAEFKKKYTPEGGTEVQMELKAKVTKAGCNVCHMKGPDGKDNKKLRNAYGVALSEFLNKDVMKMPEKIIEALDTVAAQKVAEDAEETFGQRLAEGKLPAGDPE